MSPMLWMSSKYVVTYKYLTLDHLKYELPWEPYMLPTWLEPYLWAV